jgi:formate-dependent nitrite reductase cytochrome c552 subunit
VIPEKHVSVALESISCGNCGIVFAVPDWWIAGRRAGTEGNNEFWCPNGHNRIFVENELTRTKRKLAIAERQREWAEQRATKAERKAKRLTKRVVNGVCPACQRSFENLRRHMQTKHPQLALPDPEKTT